MAIHAGYMGGATVGGDKVRITGSSLNPVQGVEAPDLIQGSYDRMAYVYGKIETGGNLTGPVANDTAGGIFGKAFTRDTDGDKMDWSGKVEIAYYKGGGR